MRLVALRPQWSRAPSPASGRGEVSSRPNRFNRMTSRHNVMKYSLSLILAALTLVLAVGPASRAAAQTTAPVDLRILAINDFHGNLRPPPAGIRIADPEDKTKKTFVAAGGAEHMATLVKQLRDGHRNTVFVAAGDLIGASPFLSAMFHDE